MATTKQGLPVTTLNIGTAYPSGIDTIVFDRNGDIVRITFSDGTQTLNYPGHRLAEQSLAQVDLVGMYHLPAHFTILMNKSTDKYMYGIRMPGCKIIGYETDNMDGEMIMRIASSGDISVTYPNEGSSDSNNPLRDLFNDGPLENVDVLALKSYTLLEYRDRNTGKIELKIV